jgi:arylsulfatase A-like enzyme/GH43 family beta-xylosidase
VIWNARLLLFAVLVLGPCVSWPAAGAKPNIITVFIDDMGWSDLSCFGGKHATTEHIDRLADEGIRFHNFYVNSPICSPSRTALTTGQYPQRWRISSYLAHRKANNARGMAQWLDAKAPSVARELQRAGYATGHFGKWHMGGQRDVGEAPLITEYGFDRSLTNFEGLGPRVLPLCDAYNGKKPRRHDLGSAGLGRGPILWEDRSVVTAAFVKDALKFIDQAQASGKPFFVNLWPDDVHSPFFPPEVLRDKTDGSKRALYYAVLDAMDQQLGALFDRIRNDNRLRNNTLILVASDNGHEEGAGLSDPLRGAKTWLYEGGIRSPLIAWGPGLLAKGIAGTVNKKSIFCALDLNRSFYTLAGIAPPDGAALDGEDLVGTLLGREKKSRRAPIFFRRPPDRPGSKTEDNPDLAVRDGKWKFTVNYDGSIPQLFDLDADVAESRNLAGKHADVVARMTKAVFEWNAALPTDAGAPSYVSAAGAARAGAELAPGKFVNPIGEGADPWVVRDPKNSRYLWCLSDGNRAIAVQSSYRLTSLGQRHIVWRAPETGPVSRQVWAPELHLLEDRWHIYFAASDGKNENHLAYVLRSTTVSPLGPYELHGPLATGDGADGRSPNTWAIDMTPLEHDGRLYALWSGWDSPGTDQQYLYIAPMKSPTELGGPRVRLCANDDYPWEFTEPGGKGRGLNEGPQVLKSGARTFVTYSCGASWLSTYKLGLLELTGRDPLDAASWTKHEKPVFSGTDQTCGVGHSCFAPSLDGSQWWHVFHAKQDPRPGWRRAVFAQPMRFGERGFPLFGTPVAAGLPLDRPAKEHLSAATLPRRSSLKSERAPSNWSYYGHHQFFLPAKDGLHLGCIPRDPINVYRCGEKIVLDRRLPDDFSAEVTIDFLGDGQARDAGILFRTTGPAVGYDAQRGYFAGLIPKTGLIVAGKMDGRRWKELARAVATIEAGKPQKLRVEAAGDQISVSLNGRKRIAITDDAYAAGGIGLRVVDTHAVFSELEVRAVSTE